MTDRLRHRPALLTVRRFVHLVVAAAAVGGALLSGEPLSAQVALQYTCQLDLHQGDTGSLELTRTSGGLTGAITVRRGDAAPLTTTITGTWSGNTVDFTRALSSTSSQPFAGVAMRSTDGSVKLAGRFASEFAGVWSADCTRTGSGAVRGQPGGVPPNAGAALPPTSGSCSIAGAATGPRAAVTSAFKLMLFGPDDDKRLRANGPMGSGQFKFTDLPPGRYVLVPDTKADVAVTITPPRAVVTCRPGAALTGVNFDFR